MNQDFIAWVGQGTVTDRSREHLGQSDRGVIMMRKRFFDDIEAVAKGEEPSGLVRDPAVNDGIELPIIGRQLFKEGMTREQLNDSTLDTSITSRRFIFQAGQPEEVRRAFEIAMGVELADHGFVEHD